MSEKKVCALIFVQPGLGRTRLPVIEDYVYYNKGGQEKSARLVDFVSAFMDMDPVLELKDGYEVRVLKGGEEGYIRIEAEGILDAYR